MPLQTIDSDTEILTGQFSQVITSDTNIQVTQSQLLTSDTAVVATLLRFLTGNTAVMIQPEQTITSDTEVLVNEVVLKLFRQADLTVEIGTTANPLDFGTIEAGETISHPDNPFVLFNDKGGSLKSVDARDVTIRVVQLDLIDELVGFSNGAPGQTFTVAFPPVVDDNALITVKVNDVPWTRVSSFTGLDPASEAYVFNALTGQVQFGDGIQGKVPPNGHTIKVSYSPDTILYGKQVAEQLWIGVQSNGVISSSVTVSLERRTPLDLTHVTVLHKPLTAVSGVWLATDPNRLGTNFFTGGSFDTAGGVITLGTPLPDLSQDVFVDYAYTIADDLEGGFTQIGRTVAHPFANPIADNNAKKLNFRAVIPPSASPSGPATIRFKVRFSYRQ